VSIVSVACPVPHTQVQKLLTAFDSFGLDDAPLDGPSSALLNARVAVLRHKLSRAAKTASLHNFNASYYLALSAAHDVRAH
jgi:hypothetical protein